jgi:hypothetical protein
LREIWSIYCSDESDNDALKKKSAPKKAKSSGDDPHSSSNDKLGVYGETRDTSVKKSKGKEKESK